MLFKTPNFGNITIGDVLELPESHYFEQKSADLKAAKLNSPLTAMANADGGIIVIGVGNGRVEGIRVQGNVKINDFIQCKITHYFPNVRAI
ncbi:AlbA family DNA-binding domain-containing protein [Sporosarcina sp. G11-34]|uniref:AlbA family DNA-binding domain-containing protein n=1 Tax=Sporosarcina sp. G11-34 TaxID=2849605 RepID=UPI0022A8F47D|nr:RNA-binding domain-containing protein [Sporosarcina sp. G11-34]MCZ2259751.1 ATP-binding protein [Sporosarcina sp. G11-34]